MKEDTKNKRLASCLKSSKYILESLASMLEKWSTLYIFMAVVAIVKFAITSNVATVLYPNSVFDDSLLCDLADHLYDGQWLGDYNYLTLVKAYFSSFFLATCRRIGISFLDAQIILQIFSVMLICRAVCGLIKEKKIPIYFMYVSLLFCPIFYASQTFQRLYRGGLPAIFVYAILAGYIAIYASDENNEGLLKPGRFNWFIWMFIAGIAFTCMYLNKEDSIWIVPFMVVASVLTILKWMKKQTIDKRDFVKQIVTRCIILIIPFVLLFGATEIIKSKNKEHYGMAVVTDTKGTNFAKLIKEMYSIEDPNEQEYVSVSFEKLQKLYEVSPSLSLIKDSLNADYLGGDGADRHPDDHELEDGWFYWIFRRAVSNAGFYESAEMSEAYYGKVYEEIQQAVEAGILNTHATMPSTLMSPWKKQYASKLFPTILLAHDYVISYRDICTDEANVYDSSQTQTVIKMSAHTNNVINASSKEEWQVAGWMIWKGNEEVAGRLATSDGYMKDLEWISSMDVANSDYAALNENMARNCRFNAQMDVELGNDISLEVISKEGAVLDTISISDMLYAYESENYILIFDSINRNFYQQRIVDSENRYAQRLNKITKIYATFGKGIFYIALFVYFIILIMFIQMNKTKSEVEQTKNLKEIYAGTLLIGLGILLSYFWVLFGISYTDISAYGAIVYMYLIATYPLILIFEWIVFSAFFRVLSTLILQRKPLGNNRSCQSEL